MAKISPITHRNVPEAFDQHRRKAAERTVRLTQQAIAKLEAGGRPVTLAGVSEATRSLDDAGNGLRPNTILRNPKAADLFHQHSPAYQERQRRAQTIKRKRRKTRLDSDIRTVYRGLRAPDLIQMVEDLKVQIGDLKTRQEKLQAERDEAHRLRDEALQQNGCLLAALTAKTQSPGK